MGESPALWAFVIANLGAFLASSLLAALSYLAYRQSSGKASYKLATIGFGLIVLSGLVDVAFFFGVAVDHVLTGAEFFLLQAGEEVLNGLGLGLLFYAIITHDSSASSTEDDHPAWMDEELSWGQNHWGDD